MHCISKGLYQNDQNGQNDQSDQSDQNDQNDQNDQYDQNDNIDNHDNNNQHLTFMYGRMLGLVFDTTTDIESIVE